MHIVKDVRPFATSIDSCDQIVAPSLRWYLVYAVLLVGAYFCLGAARV